MLERPAPSGRYAPRDRSLNPRTTTPNDNGPGPNAPPQTVGPTSSTNAPGNFVLTAEAWSGWPGTDTVGASGAWATPPLEDFTGGGRSGGEWSGFGYGRQTPGGYLKRVSTVMTCVDLNGRQLASFPAYGVKGRQPVDLPEWYSASPEPLVYPDWVAFMKAAASSYFLGGETVLYATGRYRSNGYPARFVTLNPQELYVDGDGEWYRGHDDNGEHLERRDICHVPYQMLPGMRRGIGPLLWTARHVVSAAVLEEYAVRIAREGVWAVLKHPDDLTASETAELQGQWIAARRSAVGAPAVLSGGLEYEQNTLTVSPKDMALLDLKWFDLSMIAAAMGVPAVLVNLPQQNGLTYQSTLMLADWHWRATLRPMAQAFSGAMSQWLLPRGTSIEFNPDRYTQPPLEERARAYEILHRIADADGRRAMTVDEIRAAERFTAYANTDPYTTPGLDDPNAVDGLIGAVPG